MKDFKQWLKENRCWDGYEPVPGKKAYSNGSCKKKKTRKNAFKEWVEKKKFR
jgi:hypothetical protein